jgi:hypothetical protein
VDVQQPRTIPNLPPAFLPSFSRPFHHFPSFHFSRSPSSRILLKQGSEYDGRLCDCLHLGRPLDRLYSGRSCFEGSTQLWMEVQRQDPSRGIEDRRCVPLPLLALGSTLTFFPTNFRRKQTFGPFSPLSLVTSPPTLSTSDKVHFLSPPLHTPSLHCWGKKPERLRRDRFSSLFFFLFPSDAFSP